MDEVKAKALRLRISGRSYNEIHKELGVPKSTLSGWFKNTVLSDGARKRLASRSNIGTAVLIKRNKMQTREAERRAKEMQNRGLRDIPKLSNRDLLVAGALLYWAEGYKRLKIRGGKQRVGHTISFVNSDEVMIRTFITFLREILKIPPQSIRLSMRLYAHINESEARKFWTQATGLAESRFFKSTYLVSGASKGIRPFNRLPMGTLHVEVCDTAKFHYLLGLIEGVKSKLGRGKVLPLLG